MQAIEVKKIRADYGNILSNKDFLIPCACYFLIVAVEFLWAFESPFILIQLYKTSIMFYGITQTIVFSCFLVGAAATKFLLDKYNVKTLIQFGMTITIAGTILFWLTSMYYPALFAGIAFMMLIALGSSILIAPFTRLALESCPQPAGTVTAIFTTATNLAGASVGLILSLVPVCNLFVVGTIAMVCVALTCSLSLYLRMPVAKRNKFKELFFASSE